MMTRTTRGALACLPVLASALSLALLVTWTRPAVGVGQASIGAGSPSYSPDVGQAFQPVTDGRAGACYSFYYDPPQGPDRPFIPLAYDAGSRWDRFDFAWPTIEPANDLWNFSAYDTLVDDLDAAGMNIVGILLWTPDWAATGGLTGLSQPDFDRRPSGWYAPVSHALLSPLVINAASSPPHGLYLPWYDVNNHWGDYVYTVVSRYGDRVKHWEMWNEPEWSYFWTGTSIDYAQLLKVGYQATKAACPDCAVLFGGLHYWQNPSFYRWVLNILNTDPTAPQNNYFFDAMSVHLYSRASSIYDEVNNIHSGMSTYNVGDHPIWLTETGVPVWGDPQVASQPKYDYAATQEEAAAYVIQSYANAWASGVGRYFFFRTHDADMNEYFGLIRNDRTLRPAYNAYQVATTYLISPTFVTRVSTDSHTNVTLWGTPHGKVSVLWNDSPITSVYTLPAAINTATLVDRLGITETVTATEGVYTFTLPGATANLVSNPDDYIIGGDPFVVIETEVPNAPPTSAVHSLAEITYSPVVTVIWEGWDNQSGVWLYDVQVRDGAGEWADWLHSTSAVSESFAGQHGHTYYFRSRATDFVGNRGTWPEEAQAHTTFDLSSTLHLSIGAFFADENRNEVWDRPVNQQVNEPASFMMAFAPFRAGEGMNVVARTEEITLTQVEVHFRDGSGHDVVSPTVGSTWEFTATVYAGEVYQLWTASVDHRRVISLTWPSGGKMYTYTYEALGLWPLARIYLPVAFRDG